MNNDQTISAPALAALRTQLEAWASELGFAQVGISGVDLGANEAALKRWLDAGYHGEMGYMADHGTMRSRPAELLPGTVRAISLRMDYRAPGVELTEALQDPNRAYISRYALGRDYHKLMRKRLTELGAKLHQAAGSLGFRAFVDSAPVLERALARQAGLGWIGKNAMLINRKAGSYFFLGEILTDLPLPLDDAYEADHCGRCNACHTLCPTEAFVGDRILDARRCISYLTIELKGPIPEELRGKMGNRIFGCDDCQIACPWNRFSKDSEISDFSPRHNLDKASLLELFAWDEATFLSRTEGMPIRRAGFESWLRNIAVALGNAPKSLEILIALKEKRPHVSALVQEHIDWALERLERHS